MATNARASGNRSTQSRATSAKRPSASSKRSSAANRNRSQASSRSNPSRARSSSGSRSNGAKGPSLPTPDGALEAAGSAVQKAKTPIFAGGAAAAGMVGGIVIGARVLRPRHKVLGIPVARKGLSLEPVAKEIGKAGQQLGRLTDEIVQARRQAKKIGDALS
jgi:hypothetical protein